MKAAAEASGSRRQRALEMRRVGGREGGGGGGLGTVTKVEKKRVEEHSNVSARERLAFMATQQVFSIIQKKRLFCFQRTVSSCVTLVTAATLLFSREEVESVGSNGQVHLPGEYRSRYFFFFTHQGALWHKV